MLMLFEKFVSLALIIFIMDCDLMLRRFLDFQLSLAEPGKPLHFLHPLIEAGDTFLYEADEKTKRGPHIRDAIDIKRWMIIVVIALLPCFMWTVWNTGIQSMVYSSGDYKLMDEWIAASSSIDAYMAFIQKDNRWFTAISEGAYLFLPILLISYAVGGFWEALFAIVRRHPITEGFLVTGILYAMILPPTIPWWMTMVGVSLGVIFSKEVFGGSGMNIVNPALACRAFLFFGFPGRMSGNVWVGGNLTTVRESLLKMNADAGKSSLDGYTQATALAQFNIPPEIKKIHIDAIATNDLGTGVPTIGAIQDKFTVWNTTGNHEATLGQLSQEQLQQFVTSPVVEGGLGLSSGFYEDAYRFATLNFGLGTQTDWNFFLGNKLGCFGETSVIAIILGAIFLIWTGVGSWRVMAAVILGSLLTASVFEFGSYFATDHGAWLSAQLGFPAYKHLLLGGLAFGLVFMATDPVSHPSMNSGKWIFGLFVGLIAIVIRVLNPAYPEGVMLAILMANVFAPLIDYYSAKLYRRRRAPRVAAA